MAEVPKHVYKRVDFKDNCVCYFLSASVLHTSVIVV